MNDEEEGEEEEEELEEVEELSPSPDKAKKRFKSLEQMKKKCSGRVRWEIGFSQLVPVADREDPKLEIEKLEKPIITKEDISIM